MNRCLPIGLVSMFFWACFSIAVAFAADGCLLCHEGIETFVDKPPMDELPCEFCHGGDPDGKTRKAAHYDMIVNPSDYRVAEQVCGVCHQDILNNSRKSLHATSAGIISSARYLWTAQDTRNALYGTYMVRDTDGSIPVDQGALKLLRQIPSYNPSLPEGPRNHPVDDYLREECLRCHLWSRGMERDGDYRAGGCAACHVLYSDEGTYQGGDRAISGEQKGRPMYHRAVVNIPPFQCIHCHNRGGRTGVSFIGTMESDGYGSPWSEEPGKKGGRILHGKYYNHLSPDIHYAKGIYCIDCHTGRDIHGDGNIYSKKEQAVEIECVDCHGTPERYSKMETSRGNPMPGLKRDGGKIFLKLKGNGREVAVPQVADVIRTGPPLAMTAMAIKGHMNRLECYACHARWAPQCYGCHVQQDLGERSFDWINTGSPDDLSRAGEMEFRGRTTFRWRETRSYLRWENPVLGINSEGMVSPFIPGCQVIFTQTGTEGKAVYRNHVFTLTDGISAIASNPIQPHTVSRKARACEECHANPKALGLGSGIYDPKANGIEIDFELEQTVNRDGRQLQATSHEGARPFNREELHRITRVNVCFSCHQLMNDAQFWKKVTDRTGLARTNAMHKELLKDMMEKSIRPLKE